MFLLCSRCSTLFQVEQLSKRPFLSIDKGNLNSTFRRIDSFSSNNYLIGSRNKDDGFER